MKDGCGLCARYGSGCQYHPDEPDETDDSNGGRRGHGSRPVKRTRCGSPTRGGGTCKKRAGWGTDHVGYGPCRTHGGKTPGHLTSARRAIARDIVELHNLRRDISPQEALIEAVELTAYDVLILRLHVEHEEDPLQREAYEERYDFKVSEMAKFSRDALKAGVEERAVRLAEDQGRIVARVIVGVAKRLGVDSTTREFALAVREELSLAASSPGDVIDVTPKRGRE